MSSAWTVTIATMLAFPVITQTTDRQTSTVSMEVNKSVTAKAKQKTNPDPSWMKIDQCLPESDDGLLLRVPKSWKNTHTAGPPTAWTWFCPTPFSETGRWQKLDASAELIGCDFLRSLSKSGKIFKPIMISSNSLSICSSDSSTEPWGSTLWFTATPLLVRGWEPEPELGCFGDFGESGRTGWRFWVSGFWDDWADEEAVGTSLRSVCGVVWQK